MIVIWWIIFSLLAGAIGDNRKVGFWAAFLWSIFLSPLVGIIIALASERLPSELQLKERNANAYRDYKEARKNNEAVLRVKSLDRGQEYVNITSSDIPNSAIGTPVAFMNYVVGDGKTVKAGKHVANVSIGGQTIKFNMPFEGKVFHIHNSNTFLLVGDPLFIAEYF